MNIIDEIDVIIHAIYMGNHIDIDKKLFNLFDRMYNDRVINDKAFLEILTIIEPALKSKNYVLIVDLLEFEVKALIDPN